MAFLSSVNQTTVVKFYSNVMDDVLAGVREAFLDEGVDEQVLQELRQMWESKVLASKAVDPPEIAELQPPPLQQVSQQQAADVKPQVQKPTNGVQAAAATAATALKLNSVGAAAAANSQQNTNAKSFAQATTTAAAATQQTVVTNANTIQDLNNKMVPIQLTLPPPAGSQDTTPRQYNIQVPASALATEQLQRILTAPVISATMALPVNVASTLLQQHVTAALQGQTSTLQAASTANNGNVQLNGGQGGMLLSDNSNNRQFSRVNQISGNLSQIDGTYNSDEEDDTEGSQEAPVNFTITVLNSKMQQVDGIYDTSDDDDDDEDDDDDDIDDDDDDDDDDNKEDEENEEAENGVEEDPLNSGDDVSEGDNTDLFETENVVVCQYDKINRSRNKWKFYLKDGIMNLSGRDYIFQKANGDAEW